MYRKGFTALWSHWRRRPLQLATLVLGLALATALWSGVQAINAEARASYDDAAQAMGETRFIQLVPQVDDTLPKEAFVTLRRAGWMVSPLIEGRLTIGQESYRIIGFDPLTAPLDFAPSLDAQAIGLADFFSPPFQIIAHPDTAAALRDQVSAQVLTSTGLAPGLLLSDLSAVQDWLGREAQISRMILVPGAREGGRPIAELVSRLEQRAPGQDSDIKQLTNSFHLNLTAFGLLSFAVGLFIVQGTIGLAFEQRRALFRTLRALGMPLRTLLILVALELMAIAVISAVIGMALGYGIAASLLPDVAATLRGLYGAEVDGALSLRLSWWLAGLAIAIAGTAVAAAGAFYKVARMPVLAPALPRAWSRQSEQRIYLLLGAAGALAAVAAIAYAFGGLLAGFVFLAAMLVAAAVLLPVALFALVRLAQSFARGPIADWFWADTRQQIPGLSLALMALLLALATNIGVGTMVSSFRLTFQGYLDQRMSSELYVTAKDDQEAVAVQGFLAGRVDAVLPIWHVDARINGLPTEIFGIIDHTTYRQNWPILTALPDAWAQVNKGDGALINEQMSRRFNLAPGDMVDLPNNWSIQIAGVYSDYGNSSGQVIVALSALEEHFVVIDRRRFGIRTAEGEAVALALIEDFGLAPDQIVDQASIKAFSLGIFERTFTVTGALNVLTLAVAGFAILTSLLTLGAVRQPQLAPVWALGLTRHRLALLELARALVLALFTALLALPLGLLLAWSLLAVINVEAFGWRLPMFLFPADWVRLGAWTVFAAFLAALLPTLRLARIAPSQLLQVFANER